MHSEYTMIMSLALDGRATEAEKLRLQAHLVVCQACAATWEQFRLLDKRLGAPTLLDAPEGFAGRVMARLGESRKRQRHWRWLGSGLALAWVMALALLPLLALGLIWWGLHHPIEASVMLSALAQLASVTSRGLRTAGSALTSIGPWTLALVWGLLIGLAGCLGLLWVWVILHSQPLVRTGAVTKS